MFSVLAPANVKASAVCVRKVREMFANVLELDLPRVLQFGSPLKLAPGKYLELPALKTTQRSSLLFKRHGG